MAERLARGLLDTSVVIDLDVINPAALPEDVSISAITLAELSAGPAAATDASTRARRQDRLQRAEALFEPLAFGVEAARAFGRVHAAVLERGRSPRRRVADLLIASVAVAEGLPLVTRNADDLAGLEDLLTVVEV